MIRDFHPANILPGHAFDRLQRAGVALAPPEVPRLVNQLDPALLRRIELQQSGCVVDNRVQRLGIHLHGEAVAWRAADPDPAGTAPASAAFFQLLLGPIRCQRPLLEVPANVIRTGAVEDQPVLEHGEGEFSENVPVVEEVDRVLHLEAQAPEKLDPVGVAVVGGAVDHKAPCPVAVVLELPLDQVGSVVLP